MITHNKINCNSVAEVFCHRMSNESEVNICVEESTSEVQTKKVPVRTASQENEAHRTDVAIDRITDKDVLVVRNAADKSCYILQVNVEQKIGKTRVSLKDIIGEPYGSYYELVGRNFVKAANIIDAESAAGDNGQGEGDGTEADDVPNPQPSGDSSEGVNIATGGASSSAGTALLPNFNSFTNIEIQTYLESIAQKNASIDKIRGDNSFYVDTNTAQKLSDAEITALRNQGLSGEDIIKQLINNSSTFGAKSDFAQAKWIKKKEKKYRKKYQVLRSTPITICETSYFKNREKISNMRFESLAQIVSQAGIHAGTHVLVVESLVGMMIGTIAYRMRGQGRILAMYGSQQPHLDVVRTFNLAPEYINIIETIPANELGPAAKDVCKNGFAPYEQFTLESQKKPESSKKVTEEELEQLPNKIAKKKRRLLDSRPNEKISNTGRSAEAQLKNRSYLRQGVDRLIIASRFRPLPILKQALFLLAPSSPFVVYHEFLEPLVDCYLYLQQSGLALRLQMFDSWLREFQTLPGRMRPDMFMTTNGGFILSGIYIGMVPCEYPFAASSLDQVDIDAGEEAVACNSAGASSSSNAVTAETVVADEIDVDMTSS